MFSWYWAISHSEKGKVIAWIYDVPYYLNTIGMDGVED